uniref:exodeoxyribonuclease III n=1 Tax=Labrus bergylta TaxID=56723 RepID=A0A3Q3NRE5_9LABR
MSNIKIITLNVKGINNVVKRRKILSMLKKDKVQVALLQETHLTDLEHLKLKRDWVGQIFYSSFNSKSRGVAILIHKNMSFKLEKVIHDTEGRYVVITGFLYGEHVLMGSAYAPNTFDSSFYSKLLADISSICPPFVILGGDFNCGLVPEMDHSPSKTLPLSRMAKATKDLCLDLGLFDAWRIINPREKDFTFFSRPHRSFSRIDYLFVSRSTLDRTKSCSIDACILSDHSLVSIELLPPYYDPLSRHWRLNSSLLSDPEFVTYLEKQWELFISTNESPDVSASTLWETGKAFLRGGIISYTAAKRKNALAKQLELEQQIKTLDRVFKTSSSVSVFKKLEAARSALDQLLTQKAESAIFFAKHRLFESGNKPGRLLASLAKGRAGSCVIPSLKDFKGKQHFETKVIRDQSFGEGTANHTAILNNFWCSPFVSQCS